MKVDGKDNISVGEALRNRIKDLRRESKVSANTTKKKEFVDKRPPFFTGEQKYGEPKVKISDESRAISKVLAGGLEEPEIDFDKVSSLKAQIKNGTYEPDYDQVAKNILKEELNNLN